MTVLDAAHAAMEAGGDAERLRFFERVADSELFLLLAQEAQGQTIEPHVFPLPDGQVVLAFDTEERLEAFAGGAPYAALSGRSLVLHLEGRGLSLGLNLDVAPSSFLMGPDAVSWLAEALRDEPELSEATPEAFVPPVDVPETLLRALDAKLPGAAGLARAAWLAGVRYTDGRHGHLLAFEDAVPEAEPALARAVREALVFSGLEAGELDVSFLRLGDPVLAGLANVALRLDIPRATSLEAPGAPGTDPDRPPKLR